MRDPVEQYETNAEAFYHETRIMAPGKDISAAMGGYDEDELRAKLWRVWLEKQHMAERISELESQLSAVVARETQRESGKSILRGIAAPEVYRG